MAAYDEQQLAALIAALPPAPDGWIAAAQQLPAARRAIDTLAQQAQADADRRATILDDLESALRQAGVQPRRSLVDQLRNRLGTESDSL